MIKKSVGKKIEELKSPDFLMNVDRRFKMLDARISDLSNSTTSSRKKGKLSDSNGLHESLLSEMNALNDEIKDIRRDIERRDEEILFLINQSPNEKNLSDVLGDKLQYKMDSLAIVQGRMRKKMKDMENKFENNEVPSKRLETPSNDIKNKEAEEFETIRHGLQESLNEIRSILREYNLSIQKRFQSFSQDQRRIESRIDKLSDTNSNGSNRELSGKYKVLDAKIDDVNERLLIGMHSMQVSLGDQFQKLDKFQIDSNKLPESQGLRESLRLEMNELNDEVNTIKKDLNLQKSLRTPQSETDSHILGDKWQQKIDKIGIVQGVMKRQIDEVEKKVESSPYELQKLNEKVYDIEKEVKRLEKERPSAEGVSRKEFQDVRDELQNIKKSNVRTTTPPVRRQSPSPPPNQRNSDPHYSNLKQQVEDIEEQNKYQSDDFRKFKADTENQLTDVKKSKKEVEKKVEELEYRNNNQEKDINDFKNQTQEQVEDTKKKQNKVLGQVDAMDKIQKEQAREIRDVKRDLGDEIKERKNEENEINQAHQRLRGRVKRLKLRVRKIKEVVMKDQVDSDDDDKGDI
ncbi:uncharacterized protein [Lepeophtheirus salmonis]